MAEAVRKRIYRDYANESAKTKAKTNIAKESAIPKGGEQAAHSFLREGTVPFVFAMLCGLWTIGAGIAPAGLAAVAAICAIAPTLFVSPTLPTLCGAVGAILGLLLIGAIPQAIACGILFVAWEAGRRLGVRFGLTTIVIVASVLLLASGLAFGPHTMFDAVMAVLSCALCAVLIPVIHTALSVRPRGRTLLSSEELICLALTGMAMVCGTQDIHIGLFQPALLGASILAIACGSVGGAAVGAAGGVLLGACLALGASSMGGMAVTFGLAGLMAGTFKRMGRAGSVVAYILGALIASAVGGSEPTLAMFAHILAAGLVVLLIPSKTYKKMITRVDRAKNAASVKQSSDGNACSRASVRLSSCATLFSSLSDSLAHNTSPQECAEAQQSALVARQLEAVGHTFLGLEQELGREDPLDTDRTQILRESLDRAGYRGATADIVRTHDGLEAKISFRTCNGQGDCIKKITSIVTRCAGKRMRCSDPCAPSSGACKLRFEEVPTFDAITGIACRALTSPCGDSHAFCALPGGRFMMAIADGMGSGRAAASESDQALTMLEKFLKARIDPGIALGMINDIMLVKGGEEMYTTLDLCLLDLKQGKADFYKIGAANSYIRRGKEAMHILSGALPMGILGGVAPIHHEIELKDGDVVIMVSDGICDASQDENWIRDQLLRMDPRNPQSTADLLLSAAQFEAAGAEDDRTVLCARIFFRGH